jgi:hypothetical protein
MTILTGAEDNTYRSRGQYLQEQRAILTGVEDNTYGCTQLKTINENNEALSSGGVYI